MDVIKVALATPYRWIGAALALLRRQPRPLLTAAFFLLGALLLVTLVQVLVGRALPDAPWLQTILSVLLSVVLIAPLRGGFYRLVDGLYRGQARQAGELFAIYRDAAAARRLVAVQLLFFLLTLLLVIVPAFVFGGEELRAYLQALAALQPGATRLPRWPAGLGPLLSLLALVALLLTTAKELAIAQVALDDRLPAAAATASLRLVARNAGSLLLFYLPLAVIVVGLGLIVLLVLALLAMLLNLISPALSALLLLPAMLGVMLVIYPLSFGFFYFAWRDCLGAAAAGPPQAPAEHQIEA